MWPLVLTPLDTAIEALNPTAQKELNNHISESGRGSSPVELSSENATPVDTLNAASCRIRKQWTQLATPGFPRNCAILSVCCYTLLSL